MKIVLASSNAGKIKELSALLLPLNIELIPQLALGVNDAEETGITFVENALLKARHAAAQTGLPAIADDSGLVVPALQGAPGIYSARYAGKKAESNDNIAKLLHELAQVPEENRQAYFFCCLTFLSHAQDPTPLICTGKWYGKILHETRGTQGFGYDPIFYLPDQGKTAAELPLEIKNTLSHRAIALNALLNALPEKL